MQNTFKFPYLSLYVLLFHRYIMKICIYLLFPSLTLRLCFALFLYFLLFLSFFFSFSGEIYLLFNYFIIVHLFVVVVVIVVSLFFIVYSKMNSYFKYIAAIICVCVCVSVVPIYLLSLFV